jgi:hypothetical protein
MISSIKTLLYISMSDLDTQSINSFINYGLFDWIIYGLRHHTNRIQGYSLDILFNIIAN